MRNETHSQKYDKEFKSILNSEQKAKYNTVRKWNEKKLNIVKKQGFL